MHPCCRSTSLCHSDAILEFRPYIDHHLHMLHSLLPPDRFLRDTPALASRTHRKYSTEYATLPVATEAVPVYGIELPGTA
jgi:hypothetical protein